MTKIAFYPCCADDFEESYAILSELVDEIIYCDKSKSAQKNFNEHRTSFPKAQFILRDAVEAIKEIDCIDVFFIGKILQVQVVVVFSFLVIKYFHLLLKS